MTVKRFEGKSVLATCGNSGSGPAGAKAFASAVIYLASKDSAFIGGTELLVDGGMSQL